MIDVVQYNILKIFTMHFSKINKLTLKYKISLLILNERDIKILRNTNVVLRLSYFQGKL